MDYPFRFGVPDSVATSAQLFLLGLVGATVLGIVCGLHHGLRDRRSALATVAVALLGSLVGFVALPLSFVGVALGVQLVAHRL